MPDPKPPPNPTPDLSNEAAYHFIQDPSQAGGFRIERKSVHEATVPIVEPLQPPILNQVPASVAPITTRNLDEILAEKLSFQHVENLSVSGHSVSIIRGSPEELNNIKTLLAEPGYGIDSVMEVDNPSVGTGLRIPSGSSLENFNALTESPAILSLRSKNVGVWSVRGQSASSGADADQTRFIDRSNLPSFVSDPQRAPQQTPKSPIARDERAAVDRDESVSIQSSGVSQMSVEPPAEPSIDNARFINRSNLRLTPSSEAAPLQQLPQQQFRSALTEDDRAQNEQRLSEMATETARRQSSESAPTPANNPSSKKPDVFDFLLRELPNGYKPQLSDGGFIALEGPNYDSATRLEKSGGWKFHLSIDPRDVPKAWDIVTPILIESNVDKAKVANDLFAAKFHNPADPQAGKQITLYDSGDLSWADQIRKIEIAFRENNIRPSAPVSGDKMIPGSAYAGYRNEMAPDHLMAQRNPEFKSNENPRYLSISEITDDLIPRGLVAPDMAHNPGSVPDTLQHIDFSHDAAVQAAGTPMLPEYNNRSPFSSSGPAAVPKVAAQPENMRGRTDGERLDDLIDSLMRPIPDVVRAPLSYKPSQPSATDAEMNRLLDSLMEPLPAEAASGPGKFTAGPMSTENFQSLLDSLNRPPVMEPIRKITVSSGNTVTQPRSSNDWLDVLLNSLPERSTPASVVSGSVMQEQPQQQQQSRSALAEQDIAENEQRLSEMAAERARRESLVGGRPTQSAKVVPIAESQSEPSPEEVARVINSLEMTEGTRRQSLVDGGPTHPTAVVPNKESTTEPSPEEVTRVINSLEDKAGESRNNSPGSSEETRTDIKTSSNTAEEHLNNGTALYTAVVQGKTALTNIEDGNRDLHTGNYVGAAGNYVSGGVNASSSLVGAGQLLAQVTKNEKALENLGSAGQVLGVVADLANAGKAYTEGKGIDAANNKAAKTLAHAGLSRAAMVTGVEIAGSAGGIAATGVVTMLDTASDNLDTIKDGHAKRDAIQADTKNFSNLRETVAKLERTNDPATGKPYLSGLANLPITENGKPLMQDGKVVMAVDLNNPSNREAIHEALTRRASVLSYDMNFNTENFALPVPIIGNVTANNLPSFVHGAEKLASLESKQDPTGTLGRLIDGHPEIANHIAEHGVKAFRHLDNLSANLALNDPEAIRRYTEAETAKKQIDVAIAELNHKDESYLYTDGAKEKTDLQRHDDTVLAKRSAHIPVQNFIYTLKEGTRDTPDKFIASDDKSDPMPEAMLRAYKADPIKGRVYEQPQYKLDETGKPMRDAHGGLVIGAVKRWEVMDFKQHGRQSDLAMTTHEQQQAFGGLWESQRIAAAELKSDEKHKAFTQATADYAKDHSVASVNHLVETYQAYVNQTKELKADLSKDPRHKEQLAATNESLSQAGNEFNRAFEPQVQQASLGHTPIASGSSTKVQQQLSHVAQAPIPQKTTGRRNMAAMAHIKDEHAKGVHAAVAETQTSQQQIVATNPSYISMPKPDAVPTALHNEVAATKTPTTARQISVMPS